MEELSIKVTIAGRIYPLTIKVSEEENVRKAAKMINDRLKEFEANYAVRDKQDLLAMTALQFATQNIENDKKVVLEDKGVVGKLNELDLFVSDYLEETK